MIKNKLQFLYTNLPKPDKWKIWLFIALLVKTSFFLFKVFGESKFLNTTYLNTFASDGGDSTSYIEPIENLITFGNYLDDYRMPGYGWLYFLLRLFLPISSSLNVLVILQLVLSVLSVYILAQISLLLFKKQSYFYFTFLLYGISTFVSLYDHVLLTESFCTSSLIFSFYFLLKSENSKSNSLLTGLFITWCIFLRPVLAPLLILFSLYVLCKNRKATLNLLAYNWKMFFIFILPFLIIDGLWTARNFHKYNRIYPLTKSVYYPETEESYFGSLIRFMNAYGGSIVWWEPGSDITFFRPAPGYIKKKIEVKPPQYIYTSKFNFDSLVVVKNLIDELNNPLTENRSKSIITANVKRMLDSYSTSIKDEKPYLYYIFSRFRVMKSFFVHSGTYNLFQKCSFELNKFELFIKIFYSLLYVWVALLGFFGCFLLFVSGIKNIDYLLLSTVGLYIALVFPFLLKMDESRYFVPGYPFFVLAGVFASISVFSFFKNKIQKNA